LSDKLAGHRVRTEIADGLPLIKIDFALLEQALQNVLWNSIIYTPEGTEIVIRAFREQNRIVIIVEDNGPGVKEAELPFIFDKFYRTKEAPPGGTGLGLAITKAIVEAHDGEVAARNKKEGGLEVRFVLPIEEQPVLKELPNE
jgi:two-component system sensor histidine kinase KdpD